MDVRAIEFNLSAPSKHKSTGKRRSKGQKDGELTSILRQPRLARSKIWQPKGNSKQHKKDPSQCLTARQEYYVTWATKNFTAH